MSLLVPLFHFMLNTCCLYVVCKKDLDKFNKNLRANITPVVTFLLNSHVLYYIVLYSSFINPLKLFQRQETLNLMVEQIRDTYTLLVNSYFVTKHMETLLLVLMETLFCMMSHPQTPAISCRDPTSS